MKELYLEWQEGLWVLYSLRGSKGRTQSTIRTYAGHPFPTIVLAAEAFAKTFKEGATLTIITGKGYRGREHREYPAHE